MSAFRRVIAFFTREGASTPVDGPTNAAEEVAETVVPATVLEVQAPVVTEPTIPRVNLPASSWLRSVPLDEDFVPPAATYAVPPFTLGVRDGSEGVSSEHSEAVVTKSVDALCQKAVNERVARAAAMKAKLVRIRSALGALEAQAAKTVDATRALEARRGRVTSELEAWRLEAARYQREVSRRLREQALQRSRGHRVRPLSGQPLHGDMHTLAALVGGVLFLLAFVWVILSDLALSAETLAVFGLEPADGTAQNGWPEVIANLRSWRQNWTGVALAFGMTSIVVALKWVYEQVRFANPLRRTTKDRVVLWMSAAIATVTLLLLGVARAEEILQRDSSEFSYFSVPFLGSAVMPLAFSWFGAILLSEGLHRIGSRVRIPWRRRSNASPEDLEDQTRDQGCLDLLLQELSEVDAKLEPLRASEEQIGPQLSESRAELERVAAEIEQTPELVRADLEYWARVREWNLALYRHGVEVGRRLLSAKGPYRVISETLTNDVLRPRLGRDGAQETRH